MYGGKQLRWRKIAWALILADQHDAGVSAALTASRKKLSVVDCVSFETMRRLGIRSAFCFDAHFAEQGFVTKQFTKRVN